jgi:protein-S-isoprenylcysteine O-methyltransferase Ste14
MESKYLFFAQIILLLLLFYFSNFTSIFANALLAIPFAAGLILALWAYYNMGSKIYSPFPEPRKSSQIVEGGPYKYIRHPMYTGLLLISVVLFLSQANFLNFFFLVIFFYVVDEKAKLEEKLLTKLHSQYTAFASKTKMFIPFLY